ncbi:MAG: hypothetical protein SGPRY_004355 [Prymnesium sp.]
MALHESGRDENLAHHILLQHAAGVKTEPAEWPLEKLRAYLEYAKATFQPTMTRPAERVLVTYFSLQRQADQRNAALTTIRMLEAMVRLAQAHARLMFRSTVSLQDSVIAFSEQPDEEYKALEVAILDKLKLTSDGDPISNMGNTRHPGSFDHDRN